MSDNQQLGLHQNLQLDDPTTLETRNDIIPRYALLIGDILDDFLMIQKN